MLTTGSVIMNHTELISGFKILLVYSNSKYYHRIALSVH